jgi:hypothetical protein
VYRRRRQLQVFQFPLGHRVDNPNNHATKCRHIRRDHTPYDIVSDVGWNAHLPTPEPITDMAHDPLFLKLVPLDEQGMGDRLLLQVVSPVVESLSNVGVNARRDLITEALAPSFDVFLSDR